jgi:hypothetical protein
MLRLSLLSPSVALIGEARVEDLVRGMLSEMRRDYSVSVKRAILDYVLRNGKERQRLNIALPPSPLPDWGNAPPYVHFYRIRTRTRSFFHPNNCSWSGPSSHWRDPIHEAYLSLSALLRSFFFSVISLSLAYWRCSALCCVVWCGVVW